MKELEVAIKSLEEHKAENIVSIDVSKFNPFASNLVLATCLNVRALGAMAELLDDAFEKNKIKVRAKEGNPISGWMIVEAGDVIVHLLLESNRKELNLEGLMDRLNTKNK